MALVHTSASGSINYNAVNERQFWITTQALPERLRRWQNNESHKSADIKSDHGKKINAVLKETDEILGICTYNKINLPDARHVLDLVCPEDLEISIEILLDTLSSFGNKVYGMEFPFRSENRSTHISLFRRLEYCGWCPGFLHRLKRVFLNTTFLYYASTLGPPRANKDHSKCSVTTCSANQIEDGAYKTKHVDETGVDAQENSTDFPPCNCSRICANLGELNDIIQAGGTPLISVRWPQRSNADRNLEDLDFKVVRRSTEVQYIAFSHV